MPARSATKAQPSPREEERANVVGVRVLIEAAATLGEESPSDQVPKSIGENRASNDGRDVSINTQTA